MTTMMPSGPDGSFRVEPKMVVMSAPMRNPIHKGACLEENLDMG